MSIPNTTPWVHKSFWRAQVYTSNSLFPLEILHINTQSCPEIRAEISQACWKSKQALSRLKYNLLTTAAEVPRAQALSSRPSVAFVTPVMVPEIPRRINSLGQEEELTEIDDDDIPPRRSQWGERRRAKSFLQASRNVRSRLRYVSESNNFLKWHGYKKEYGVHPDTSCECPFTACEWPFTACKWPFTAACVPGGAGSTNTFRPSLSPWITILTLNSWFSFRGTNFAVQFSTPYS